MLLFRPPAKENALVSWVMQMSKDCGKLRPISFGYFCCKIIGICLCVHVCIGVYTHMLHQNVKGVDVHSRPLIITCMWSNGPSIYMDACVYIFAVYVHQMPLYVFRIPAFHVGWKAVSRSCTCRPSKYMTVSGFLQSRLRIWTVLLELSEKSWCSDRSSVNYLFVPLCTQFGVVKPG